MDSKVGALAATTDTSSQTPRAPAQELGLNARPSVDTSQDQADLRLIIEETNITGSYIYKTVDRRTGEVVSQFPREQIIRMRDQVDYAAGSVIRTKA
jgi:flagellar protein FlaG